VNTTMRIEKTNEIGFCFGVRRAIDITEKLARERGGVETLGAVVHNQQVLQRLAQIGVRIVNNVADVEGDTLVISAHGVSPRVEEESRARHISLIDTTCPFVRRAQITAQKLAESDFFVIIYGDTDHPEVKGVLGWAQGKGLAALDESFIANLDRVPSRLGILSQTTQMPAKFTEFASKLINSTFAQDSELRLIDTICHDIRKRQEAATKLAGKVDLMLVIGGHTSANTKHLAELCAMTTKTYLIETAEEIQPSWLQSKNYVGVTSGTSTDEPTINEVMTKLTVMPWG